MLTARTSSFIRYDERRYSGALAYRIEGNMIYQEYSNAPVYRIEGNKIYQGYSGALVYRIE
jgi:hypothetical protein